MTRAEIRDAILAEMSKLEAEDRTLNAEIRARVERLIVVQSRLCDLRWKLPKAKTEDEVLPTEQSKAMKPVK